VYDRSLLRAVRHLFSPLRPDDYLEFIKPAVDDEGDVGVESSAWFQQGSDAARMLIRPGYE
jgi:stearoyl-CoA 9-desaturase NADPH oxidoreductase